MPIWVLTMLESELSPRAELDMESIAIFLGNERKNPQAALEAIYKIEMAIDLVCEFPDMGGRVHRDELDNEYRTIPADPYIIYYRFDEKMLTVCRVIHQRQDIDVYTLVDF